MRAVQYMSAQQESALVEVEVARPVAGAGELLIEVRDAGVTPSELMWYPTTHTKDGGARTGAIPGHEFAGGVAAALFLVHALVRFLEQGFGIGGISRI